MIKKLDENSATYPDHVGWRLWAASRAWQSAFVDGMRAAGHGWMTDARATLLAHIARGGTPQSAIADRMGISKQAVQQLVDGLVADEILERIPDPDDRRGRIIRHTPRGLAAMRHADRVKQTIEEAARSRIGDRAFEGMMADLASLVDQFRAREPG